MLTSISPIKKKYDSQTMPVLVMGSDLNEYVCKYQTPSLIFREHIGASFAKLWNIPTPDHGFLKIRVEDNDTRFRIAHRYFDKPCFASKHLPFAMELHQYMAETRRVDLKWFLNPRDLLKIGLFDLWLCNEDRHEKHTNLLCNPVSGGLEIIAFDHSNIFNSGITAHNPVMLTDDESIIASDYARLFFRKGTFLTDLVQQLEAEYYLCVEKCRNGLPQIIDAMPQEVGLDKALMQSWMAKYFLQQHITETRDTFRGIVQRTFN